MTFCLHRHNLTVLDNRGRTYRDICLITHYFLTESCGADWLDQPLYNNQQDVAYQQYKDNRNGIL